MTQDINNNEEELLNEAAQESEETQNEEPQTEETAKESPEEAPKEKTVEEKLAEAEEQIAELKKQMLYKAAEFDNYRKRVMQEKAELIKNGGSKVITTILPIIDDFERAEQNMEKLEDVAACKEGVTLIIDKFMKLLKQEGLAKIDAVGKDFDTDYHEAVAMVPGMPEDKKNKVIDCIMDGYMLNDKVIRHAKVAVAE
ncbi:MAG: nucleotide exchange factor GrpE [Bacteroidaceae bacterium]|nr:nucleotide exchange factor GrpE [Bacteroidaceae bacterium]